MPYHVKTPGKLEIGDVYWKGNNAWTNVYADRQVFSKESDADAVVAQSWTSPQGVQYRQEWFKKAQVVSE